MELMPIEDLERWPVKVIAFFVPCALAAIPKMLMGTAIILYSKSPIRIFVQTRLLFFNARNAYWCASLSKSLTVFTGLKVDSGTSTNTVFQSLIEPFHSPGSSRAFRGLPFLLLLLMKPVAWST